MTDGEGINVLGNMLQPSDMTPNQHLYGDIHNTGHNMLAQVVDDLSKRYGVRFNTFYDTYVHICSIRVPNTIPIIDLQAT